MKKCITGMTVILMAAMMSGCSKDNLADNDMDNTIMGGLEPASTVSVKTTTGKTIKDLREKQKITQKELAQKICVSDKTISKWETDKGLPDIAIIEELANALGTSVTELRTGDLRENENRSANMRKMHFFVCPICGNIISSVGQGVFSCCGITLMQPEPEQCDESHLICIEDTDNEYHVTIKHPRTVMAVVESACLFLKYDLSASSAKR